MLTTRFTVSIATENDAFIPDPCEEVARILEGIIAKLRQGKDVGACRDVNGNTVGGWSLQ